MRKLKNLEEVNASALPAKVLVLLSKYANALRKHNGLILKLSSLNVFRNVHKTSCRAKHPEVHEVYQELLDEVRVHLKKGTMYTNSHHRFKNQQYRARRTSEYKVDKELRAHRAAQAAVKKAKKANAAAVRSRANHGQIVVGKEIEPQLSAFGD